MKQARSLVLASASPRRREILGKLGLCFDVHPVDLDESMQRGEDPGRYVLRLAEEKARACAQSLSAGLVSACAVLGADTTVVLDGEVLGKPGDEVDSARMLRALRGREHVVHTGVALWLVPDAQLHSVLVSTRVTFRDFSDQTLAGYVASREGMDKAGSYGIQELGAALVREVHGSYSNVVGLPAAETIELLTGAGALEAWP
jgi:septum formation protein